MRALSLFGVMALAKALLLASHPAPFSPWLPIVLLWQDAAVALAFFGIDKLVRRPWIAWTIYAGAAFYVALNVGVARVLSTPLTWPMLRAARGTLADSIRHHSSFENLAWTLPVVAAAVLLPFALRRAGRKSLLITGALGALVAILGAVAAPNIDTRGLDRNALAVLVTTFSPRVAGRTVEGDWRSSPIATPPGEDLSRYRGKARGRNVVVMMLESTGARYLKPYGAEDDPMPALTRFSGEGLLFEWAYCVYPESIKGLFSVLTSSYPALDTPPEAHGETRFPSIADALSKEGYRCGLFHSGRFMYLGMESIVRQRGFEAVEDAGDIGGKRDSSFGIDEPSAVRRVLAWIDGLKSDERFLAVYLPVAGHHPYETPERGPYPENQEIGRYRNALRYADAALEQLLAGLKQRGRHDNTVYIFMGDHGEAFHQHQGNYGHTFFVYEENVRVPFLIHAPGVIEKGQRVRRLASLLDAAPTIADLLGLAQPREWQGSSLLDGPARMPLFFTDYSQALLGLRDGDWKVIHEVESGRSKLFHLRDDPGELNDLSAAHAGLVDLYRQILVNWCAAQRARIEAAAGK